MLKPLLLAGDGVESPFQTRDAGDESFDIELNLIGNHVNGITLVVSVVFEEALKTDVTQTFDAEQLQLLLMCLAPFLCHRLQHVLLLAMFHATELAKAFQTVLAPDGGHFNHSVGITRLTQPFVGPHGFGNHLLDDVVHGHVFTRLVRTSATWTAHL